ncbi:type II secretion system protein [Tunturiibacter gelidoferens]|uniref:Type II secretion system protein G n=1 Tax=Tunturiibacter gelidiferens TaxID=3069689 RepID=A0ACC5NUN1_9BACT|nr:prepilin-type N-terminal cleavage/methylation domain-containing protein [Edaphobacter lichenicola]MBB5338277.1 type II secretion system protein G [Edaphobacter lichenicola]
MVATPPIRSARSSGPLSTRSWPGVFLLSFRSAAEESASLPQKPGCPILRSLTAKGGIDKARPADTTRISSEQGFTLLELMIVMVVIGLLAAIAIPAYTSNIRNAKEAVLKEDLHTMRQAIDSYTVDKAKAPQSLDDLVQAGYLKSMPVDPFTHRSDTWLPVQEDTNISLDQTETGIDDVHSGAQQTASDGTSYNTW